VHQAVKADSEWHLRMIGLADNRLAFMASPDTMPNFEQTLPEAVRDAPFGSIYEWRDGHVMHELAQRLVRDGGAALILDYGHVKSAAGDTLQAVRRHEYADPLEEPGLADLTAHVDFAALAETATRAGARVRGPVTQAEFLHRIGIIERANALKATASRLQAADVDAALLRLTGGGREAMGELFKVIAVADPKLETIPGFDS
jgi:SAM-dependent MidA family methyltransferase